MLAVNLRSCAAAVIVAVLASLGIAPKARATEFAQDFP